MKFKSENMTQASGSIAGVTYGHNKGGLYRRARSIPVNPQSAAQVTHRNNFSSISAAWRALTETQRLAWAEYATNNPRTDVFGDPLQLSGQQMFIRINSYRLQAGTTIVSVPPVDNGLTTLQPFADVMFEESTQDINLDVPAAPSADPWADIDDAFCLFYASMQKNPTINFFKGPYRFAGAIAGNSTTPPTNVQLVNPFGINFNIGQKIFYRAIVVMETGQLSPVLTGSSIATA